MDPNDLYSVRQQFTLGAYKALVDLPLPEKSAEDYLSILLYHVRSCLALEQPDAALSIIPRGDDRIAFRAARSLANYVKSPSEKDTYLEELRDVCVEIEGEDAEEDEIEKGLVRVLAGTAFVREGEVEEALDTLGAGSNHSNLEQSAIICHIYLTINRADLAKKEYERAHNSTWATDDLLLQHIEACIGLVTGKGGYSNAYNYFNEQLANPSMSSSNGFLLLARGVTNLMRGEYPSATADFEEASRVRPGAEAVIGSMVAAGLSKGRRAEAVTHLERLKAEYPSHPLLADLEKKSQEFDAALEQYTIPNAVTV